MLTSYPYDAAKKNSNMNVLKGVEEIPDNESTEAEM